MVLKIALFDVLTLPDPADDILFADDVPSLLGQQEQDLKTLARQYDRFVSAVEC